MKATILCALFFIFLSGFCLNAQAIHSIGPDSIEIISYDTIQSTHTVKSGQSLSYLASFYHCPINVIVLLNKLPNWQYKIKIGELLLVREIKKVVTLKYMIQNNSVSTIESVIQDSNLSESSNLEAIIADTAQLIDSFAEFSENKEKAKQKKSEDSSQQVKKSMQDKSIEIIASDTLQKMPMMVKEIMDKKKDDYKKDKQIRNSKPSKIEDDTFKKNQPRMLKTLDVKEVKKKKKIKFGEVVSQVTKEKAEFYLARAMKAIDVEEYQSAEKYTKKALEINPNYCEAWMLHGDLYGIFGYFEKAVKDYSKAIESNATMVPAYYNRGVIYLKMSNLDKAKLDFNKSLELDSLYIVALGGRASVSIYQKDFISAITDYSKIISINPSFVPAYKARGIARLEIGDYTNAISDFCEFIRNDKTDAYVYYQRGLAELKSGKMYDSCIDLLKASEMGSADAKAAIKKHCD